MIATRAPGKLFIAGEHAVVEPGEPAVLVAVDRALTVTLEPTAGVGEIHSPAYGPAPVRWRREPTGIVAEQAAPAAGYVLATIRLLDRLRAELGHPPSTFALRITSDLDDDGGAKFGLGSSAAVTVATVAAIDRHDDLGLTAMQRLRLAILATVQVVPTASGGDLAAATFGGWISYASPDRAALLRRLGETDVAAVLEEPWEGFGVARLDPPADVRLAVGWTGAPASTERLVAGVLRVRDEPAYRRFLDASRELVGTLVDACAADDVDGALDAIRGSRVLLRDLGRTAGVPIETDRLAALCDAAERAGAAAKPSGAGGGDCGIALLPPGTDQRTVHESWRADGIRPLALTVAPGSSIDG